MVIYKFNYIICFTVIFFSSLLGYGQNTVQVKKDSLKHSVLFFDADYIKDLESEPVFFDSLNVFINPPKYFKKVDTIFNGFIHIGANASIVLAKTTPILLAVAPFYDSTSFASQKETLLFKDTLTLDNGLLGYMFVVNFIHDDVEVERILYVTGNSEYSFVATATYPKSTHSLLYPVFLASFKTIKFEE